MMRARVDELQNQYGYSALDKLIEFEEIEEKESLE